MSATGTYKLKRPERRYKCIGAVGDRSIWQYHRPDDIVFRVSWTEGGKWHHLRCASAEEAERMAAEATA